ncbi:MAG: hypothetical protein CL902_01285 [Dehalococcoidia bacterium]|nr:hypothetical protein [Dehalococcoidia bacterium]
MGMEANDAYAARFLSFVSRETWGGLVSRDRLRPLDPSKVAGIVVHHTTGSQIEPDRMIAAHDRYHHVTRGWAGGLAYNWLVSADGRIWEGRGWNQGGATKGWNDKTVAVAYLGDSNVDWPVDAQAAMRVLLSEVFRRYGVGLWLKVHSDFKATDCCGGPLRDWIRGLDLEALRGAVNGSESVSGIRGQSGWTGFHEFLWELRKLVAVKPLRRWRKNHKWCVMAVQARLNDLGFDVGKADGVFGRRTKQGVQAFQNAQWHMRSNGIVGTAVWDALFVS